MSEDPVPREILKKRMFYWLRAPRNNSDLRLDEWILAIGRFLLGICYLGFLIHTSGSGISQSAIILLLFYPVFGLSVLLVLRFKTHSGPAIHFVIHLADVFLAAQLILLVPWASMSLALCLFLMASTAIRWGFWEALLTLAAFCAFLLIACCIYGQIALHHLRSINMWELLAEAMLYITLTCVIGLLAEAKAERTEGHFLAEIAARIRIEPGLQHAMHSVCSEELQLFGARQALVVAHERDSNQFSLFNIARPQEGLQSLELDASQQAAYQFPAPATCVRVAKSRRRPKARYQSYALKEGEMIKIHEHRLLSGDFQAQHPFQLLLSVAMDFEDICSLRVYVIDPKPWFGGSAGLRFLERSLRRMAPHICDLYLMRRITAEAKAIAGSQMARELHDGVIQSLFNLNMQIEDMRSQNGKFTMDSADSLARIQERIQKEITSLRDFMQQLRSMEIDSDSLLSYLAGLSVKFQCENGIVTKFISEADDVQLRPNVCGQLARIVQEALINIRKHSDAREVVIRLNHRNEKWVLSITDDGVGFGFSGCRSHEELQASGKGPLIIMERARAIDGKVSIESVEGKGTCLEIAFPGKTIV
jgi:signal transduction histidine kinase